MKEKKARVEDALNTTQAGIIDPTQVVRCAIQNAASLGSLQLL